ncbi:hypothetical protein HPB48_014030 [Haemaphysalis longicornis]|uniref:Reverse transcriptase domain-containing protein n=1 Tax=Haemaphysalis longicornis TaxID=44386 RepID=A0A9J6G6X3_HAELO|nr:hypothetical protein HPB48_014030 [Haemaphysalis longicornis]
MLATRLSRWLEQHGYHHPAQIVFRPSLDTKGWLSVFAALTLASICSHGVRTIIAINFQKAHDDISHAATLDSVDMLHLPMRVRQFVQSFLQDRTFAIRLHGVGSFVPAHGVPKGSVSPPTSFNMALISLAWRLHDKPDVKFRIYADDLTMWSTHHGLETQVSSLLSSLDVTAAFASSVSLHLSASKTTYTSVCKPLGPPKEGVSQPSNIVILLFVEAHNSCRTGTAPLYRRC